MDNKGSTLPIVFVHGLVGGLADPECLEHLDAVQVISPDLQGYGCNQQFQNISIEGQALELQRAIEQAGINGAVNLVGHSVGGVIAAAFVQQYPGRVKSLVFAEGNFTLVDAFWSARLAEMTSQEAAASHQESVQHPEAWLAQAGVLVTAGRLRKAREALAYQPAATRQATARAVVEYTRRPEYQVLLKEVFDRVEVHLVAGERSRADWDVPAWALQRAKSYAEIADTGHLLMLEAPEEFAGAINAAFQ
ncbi:pimeloyl-ACP methyl ester carboxylesterase [Psychromicrobium silvestre]|uniref:Pimeloyl-ACP methyl ester carboxylesterase n=1 Tax=Psychromicrobium silvestre TaxID=1645614 RepID=A0A7Y9S4E1_9MICC|nr:alpha/beta hydrolase [Psychromicrobium silvestre]NYE93905.1 pimeloyl-ACP methyl ester carboxylesterase [Psychromicrobium silvestre]